MTRLDDRKRWWALVVLCLGVLMIVLDTTIVNVALPSIREDLGFSETALVWVVNAHMPPSSSVRCSPPLRQRSAPRCFAIDRRRRPHNTPDGAAVRRPTRRTPCRDRATATAHHR